MPDRNANTIPTACFAPPLTDELIAKYKADIAACEPGEIKDALTECLACVEAWWNIPESTRKDGDKFEIMHKGSKVTFQVTPLESEQVKQLDGTTPWMRSLNGMSQLFAVLPQGPFCNMCHHLLWYCKEITCDREPLTQEALPA